MEWIGKLIKIINNTGIFYVPGTFLLLYAVQIHVYLILALRDKYCGHPHFTGVATEAQGRHFTQGHTPSKS